MEYQIFIQFFLRNVTQILIVISDRKKEEGSRWTRDTTFLNFQSLDSHRTSVQIVLSRNSPFLIVREQKKLGVRWFAKRDSE